MTTSTIHYYIITDAIGSLSDHEAYTPATIVTVTDKHPNDYFTVTDGKSIWYADDGELMEVAVMEYKSKLYPVRTIDIFGIAYNISTTELSKALETDNYEDEAQAIDNDIFFFVEPNEIGWNMSHLQAHIIKETDYRLTDEG